MQDWKFARARAIQDPKCPNHANWGVKSTNQAKNAQKMHRTEKNSQVNFDLTFFRIFKQTKLKSIFVVVKRGV